VQARISGDAHRAQNDAAASGVTGTVAIFRKPAAPVLPTDNLFALLEAGGLTTLLLLLLSLASLAVAVTKLFAFAGVRGRAPEQLTDRVVRAAAEGDFRSALPPRRGQLSGRPPPRAPRRRVRFGAGDDL
jgi:hypothetical protein